MIGKILHALKTSWISVAAFLTVNLSDSPLRTLGYLAFFMTATGTTLWKIETLVRHSLL